MWVGKHVVIALLAALSFGVSSAVPLESTSTAVDVDVQPLAETSPALLDKRADWCSPTGLGYCNLWINSEKLLTTTGTSMFFHWQIYDSYCNTIGSGKLGFNWSGSLKSQLPWTVELTITRVEFKTFSLNGGFWYAGHYTGLEGGYSEVEWAGISGWHRKAFQCVY